MNIQIDGIKNYLQFDYQLALEKAGRLEGHIVKIFNRALETIQQNPHLAAATIASANVLFFKIAYRMGIIIAISLRELYGSPKQWSPTRLWTHVFFVIVIPYSFWIAMNIALYKGLNPSLSPLEFSAISVVTCSTHAFFSFGR